MTVPSTARRAGPYYGSGALVSYPFSFKVFDKSHVRVVIKDSIGVESDLAVDSSALVALNPDQDASPGGSVQYAVSGVATALPSGYTLAVLSDLAYSQETDLPEGGSYRAASVEDGMDALAVQIQQLAEQAGRAFTVSPLAGAVSAVLPAPEAGKALGWNLAENALINLDAGGGSGAGLPTIAGQTGKFLTNDGTALLWGDPAGGGFAVSVFNFLNAAEIEDIRAGTLAIDVAAKVQTAIDAVRLVGGVLNFPRGQYRIGAPLVLDYSAVTADPTQGATNRITLQGEGAGATQLTATHGGALIDHRGGAGGTAGAHSFFYLKGLSLYNSTARQVGSIAVKLDNTSLWGFEDLSILGFEYGVKGTDVLSGYWDGGRLWSCTYGFRFDYADFSRPNAISFKSVAIAGNRRYGGYVVGGALFSMYGGSVEGNGIDANGLADGHATRALCWGLKFEESGVEGVVGATIHGGYFEGNSGKADLWFVQTSLKVTHSVTGCSFLRFLAAQYTVNNILYDNNPAVADCRVSVQGCGFRSQSPYTASATRTYVGSQVGKIHDEGNYFENATETDRAVFAPRRIALIPSANFPTVEQGGLIFEPVQNGLLVGSASSWRWAEDKHPSVISTNADATLVVYTTLPTVLHTGVLTANRTLTLSTTGAYVGARFKVTRLGSGAFNLSVGGLVNLLQNQWAEVLYDGTSWLLIGAGSLTPAGGGSVGTVSHVFAQRTSLLDIGTSQTQIPFNNVVYDTLGEYNPGTGIFQATVAGYYRVAACAGTNAFAWQAGKQFNIRIRKNGSDYAIGSRDIKDNTTVMSASSIVTATVYLAAFEYLSITAVTDRTPDADANNLAASGLTNHLSIDRLL